MISHLYRFRPAGAVLDKYEELRSNGCTIPALRTRAISLVNTGSFVHHRAINATELPFCERVEWRQC
jgi:hypothetical protein